MLSENDKLELETRIAEAEKLTDSQIVLATVNRSDSYAEIPWKAFALGVSVTGLAVFLITLFNSGWSTADSDMIPVAATLAAGAFFAVLTIFVPGFASIFLSVSRAETETRQYAESLFLNRELFSTARRNGILVLISRFEHKVVILPDKGLDRYITEDDLKRIIALMKEPLRQNQFRQAFETALNEITTILEPFFSEKDDENELPDKIIEE